MIYQSVPPCRGMWFNERPPIPAKNVEGFNGYEVIDERHMSH